jgi:hypothetical protein
MLIATPATFWNETRTGRWISQRSADVIADRPKYRNTGGSVSAVPDSEERVSNSHPKSAPIEIREGDWKAYQYYIGKARSDHDLVNRYGNTLSYKRMLALAYLGKRAQLHGGVCSTRHPHIMTPQFIADLEASNKSVRYARYPWLRAMMALLAEIEQIQDQISNTNVISLIPSAK